MTRFSRRYFIEKFWLLIQPTLHWKSDFAPQYLTHLKGFCRLFKKKLISNSLWDKSKRSFQKASMLRFAFLASVLSLSGFAAVQEKEGSCPDGNQRYE